MSDFWIAVAYIMVAAFVLCPFFCVFVDVWSWVKRKKFHVGRKL